jgi:hypothetical protein
MGTRFECCRSGAPNSCPQGIALRNHVVLHEPTRGEVRQRSFNVHFGPAQHNRTITQRTEIRCSME